MRPDVQPPASHFVDGQPFEDADGEPIPVLYPATGERIATVHAATPAVVEAALASAARAQRDWASVRGIERGRVLRRAADLLRERNRALSVLETLDTGKPLSETLVADAASAADALEWFGGIAASLGGSQVSLGADWAYTRREPLGVCVGIGAWNYPTQIAAWKGAPALACGNAMVFKPSETTPLGALRLAAILVEAGAPPGLYNVVQGRGDVGAALIADPRVAKVSITGSVPTGQKVYEAAAQGLKHVTLELGGKSPLVVFEDADLDAAVSGAILGNFYSTGQVCSNGTRVFVQRGVKDAFLARLTQRLKGVVMGDPLDERTNFGPLTSARHREVVEGYIARGAQEGARLVAGGGRPDVPGFPDGFWLEPTVFADVADAMSIATDEIFGPVMSVLDFDTEGEVLQRANATPFGLAAGVFTRDLARAHRMAAGFEAGTTFINAYNVTPVELPFGGAKRSGIGRENGFAAIEHYSQLKSVYVGMSPPQAPF